MNTRGEEVSRLIEVKNLTRKFGRVTAVDDVTFCIPDRGITGLLGVNGAGKTTTLNMLTGCIPPTSGQILLNGMDMMDQPRACRRLVGFLPEHPPLYDEMSVCEYLEFVCRLREVEKRDIPAHVDEILTITGLQEVRKRILGHLSRGYRQRAGIAQALCGAPPVLVLDEPTVGLDPRQVAEIRQLIRELGKKHSILFSSHILTEVQEICGRIMILHHGRLIHEADMDEVGRRRGAVSLFARISGEPGVILPAVQSLSCVLRAVPVRNAEKHVTEIHLECAAGEGGEDPRIPLFHLLSAMDAPILELGYQKNSLEEVFLRVTGREETGE